MARSPERTGCDRGPGRNGRGAPQRRGADARLPRPHRRARFRRSRVCVSGSGARARRGSLARPRARGRISRAADRPAVRREGHHRHPRHADAVRLADSCRSPAVRRRGMRCAGARGGRRHAGQDRYHRIRVAPSRGRRRTRTILRTRPEDRRADRPPRSPTSWCRLPSARRPADRSSVPRPIAAWSDTSLRTTRSIRPA